jgi:hypothetical protein
MKNEHKVEIGPKKEWGKWRATRDRAIEKPRKNAAAVKLASKGSERAKPDES